MTDLRNQLDQILTARLGDHSVTDRVLDEIWEALYPLRRELLDYQQGNTKLQAINARRHEEAERATSQAETAEEKLKTAEVIIDDLLDPDACDHFDHHGYCQTHGWSHTDPPCPHARAREFLGKTDGDAR